MTTLTLLQSNKSLMWLRLFIITFIWNMFFLSDCVINGILGEIMEIFTFCRGITLNALISTMISMMFFLMRRKYMRIILLKTLISTMMFFSMTRRRYKRIILLTTPISMMMFFLMMRRYMRYIRLIFLRFFKNWRDLLTSLLNFFLIYWRR